MSTHPKNQKAGHKVRGSNIPTGYAVSLVAIWYGMTMAVLLIITGLVFLAVPGGTNAAAQAGQGHASHDHSSHDHSTSNQTPADRRRDSPVEIAVTARHLGNLQVAITATVTMNGSDALTDAGPVAHTDMVQMPGAHTQGPLRMTAVPGRPGTYITRTAVPMPGDYDVRVAVHSPQHTTASTTLAVGTTEPQ